MASYKSNVVKMYFFEFFVALHFFSGVLVPFFTEFGKLDVKYVLFLQSWMMFWVFVFEIPTGSIADYFGQKASIVLGALSYTIASIIYSSYPNLVVFMIGEMFFALSVSLISGAKEALIYDSLGKNEAESSSKRIFGRLRSVHLAGILVAAPVGSFLASIISIRSTMYLTAIPFFISFLIGLSFKQPSYKRPKKKAYLKTLTAGVKYFAKHRVLKILALDFAVIQSISFLIIWLYQPLLQRMNIDIVYFGIVHASLVVSQILFMNSYGFLEKIFGSKLKVIFFSSLITGLMIILMGITNSILVMVIAIIIGAGFGLGRKPLFTAYFNNHIKSSERATVLSAISMFQRITLLILNLVVGFLVDWSLTYTFVLLGSVAIIFAFVSKVEESHLIG